MASYDAQSASGRLDGALRRVLLSPYAELFGARDVPYGAKVRAMENFRDLMVYG